MVRINDGHDQGVDLLLLVLISHSEIPRSTISLLPYRVAHHLLGAIEHT